MSVVDLRGPAGDTTGLAALAAALHRAAAVAERAAAAALAGTGAGTGVDGTSSGDALADEHAFADEALAVGEALRAAAAAVSTAAARLRELPAGAHAAADAVEETLAHELRRPLGTLAGALPAR